MLVNIFEKILSKLEHKKCSDKLECSAKPDLRKVIRENQFITAEVIVNLKYVKRQLSVLYRRCVFSVLFIVSF